MCRRIILPNHLENVAFNNVLEKKESDQARQLSTCSLWKWKAAIDFGIRKTGTELIFRMR